MRSACAAIIAILLASLAACTSTPQPSVKQAYLAQRLASVDASRPCYMDPFAVSPIRVAYHRILVPVSINGVNTIGILDTGAAVSLITPEFAQAAKVDMQGGTQRLAGLAGSFSTPLAIARKLQVGTSLSVTPRLVRIFPFGGSKGTVVGAQVGLDWLQGLDYDLDLPHQTLRPYRTGNCAVIDPPWRTTYSGVVLGRTLYGPYGPINVQSAALLFGQISVPVSFPSKTMQALFDTGSVHSLMSHEAALEAGATRSQLAADGTEAIVAIDGRKRTMIIHKFPDLAIGEEELRDLPIRVAPSFDRRDAGMVLGMDYIEKHHFWLSFTTNALYIDSGEPRPPTPPLDRAHWIAGSQMPAYPADANGAHGDVVAHCTVEPDGRLTGCAVDHDGGQTVLGRAVLRWLTGDYGPIMQPAYRDGRPVPDTHSWTISFVPPAK